MYASQTLTANLVACARVKFHPEKRTTVIVGKYALYIYIRNIFKVESECIRTHNVMSIYVSTELFKFKI